MLPVIPAGHCGWPGGPGRIGVAGTPSEAIAAVAHSRPGVNSARRHGPAVRTAASSAAKSPPTLGAPAMNSTAATMGGRMPAISPAGCGLGEQSAGITAGALLRPQRHPDRVRLGRARVAPGVRLIATEVQCAPGFHLVGLPGHGELQPAAGDVDQFLELGGPETAAFARFLAGNHLFFLTLAMGAARSLTEWAAQAGG